MGKWEDYPFLAARALWGRWMPEVFSPEVFIAKHFPEDGIPEGEPTSLEEAQQHWVRACAVMDLVAPPAGPPRPDLIERLRGGLGSDIDWWLGELPLTLAGHGMVDEAIQMCRRLVPVFEAEDFADDLGVILAEAGRGAGAVKQVWENLARFPGDVWIRIKGGDVYKALGDLPAAETMYRRAYGMTSVGDPRDDRDGAVERLLDLYKETGRETDRAILIATEKALADFVDYEHEDDEAIEDEPWPEDDLWEDQETEDAESHAPAWAAPTDDASYTASGAVPHGAIKVGRNDPCPCGSGKKYKRCCGR